MTTTLSTPKTEYLERVSAGLADLPAEDREDVLQDLYAHLEELGDNELEDALGTPEEFVVEFRLSAGLDDRGARRLRWSLERPRRRLDEFAARLSDLTRWTTIRPLWVWSRGWLLVSLYSILADATPFRRFPIPTIEHQTIWGLFWVIVATTVSVLLDRRDNRPRAVASYVFNVVVAYGLIVSFLLSPTVLSRESAFAEIPASLYLTDAEGVPVTNIFAYDLEGNPVSVLLYDQNGRPLRTLGSWVYHGEGFEGGAGPIDFGEGLVEFENDDLGRPIENLYPLAVYGYDGEPIPPPSLGFPSPETGSAEADGNVTTTSTALVD